MVVRNAMSKALGWGSPLDWSTAALTAAVGHATIRVRTLPQGGVVSRDEVVLHKVGLQPMFVPAMT